MGRPEERARRRDAAANRDRVLTAAAIAIRREGDGVPLATIAADAGVGVGTLYRHYPSRESLLAALTHRSFEMVLAAARAAADSGADPVVSLRQFLDRTIDHGPDLILPLHGGPLPEADETVALRADIRRTIQGIVRQGQDEGRIRPDVAAFDIIVFGALLAQPLANVSNWPQVARHQAQLYLDGLTHRPGRP